MEDQKFIYLRTLQEIFIQLGSEVWWVGWSKGSPFVTFTVYPFTCLDRLEVGRPPNDTLYR